MWTLRSLRNTVIRCEGSRLQNEGLTLLLISLPADSTTIATTNITIPPHNRKPFSRHSTARPWNLFPPSASRRGGVRGTPCRPARLRRSVPSLRPLPTFPASCPSSLRSLGQNLSPSGPSPCPCPGVDTPLNGNGRPPLRAFAFKPP